jgi:hypothetical protein
VKPYLFTRPSRLHTSNEAYLGLVSKVSTKHAFTPSQLGFFTAFKTWFFHNVLIGRVSPKYPLTRNHNVVVLCDFFDAASCKHVHAIRYHRTTPGGLSLADKRPERLPWFNNFCAKYDLWAKLKLLATAAEADVRETQFELLELPCRRKGGRPVEAY